MSYAGSLEPRSPSSRPRPAGTGIRSSSHSSFSLGIGFGWGTTSASVDAEVPVELDVDVDGWEVDVLLTFLIVSGELPVVAPGRPMPLIDVSDPDAIAALKLLRLLT